MWAEPPQQLKINSKGDLSVLLLSPPQCIRLENVCEREGVPLTEANHNFRCRHLLWYCINMTLVWA